MGFTTPKTWNFKETFSSADANTYIRDNIIYLKKSNPIGEIKMWPGDTAPEQFVFCHGQEVSRTGVYEDLYNLFGDTFGNGDGSTTFNLPNTQGKTIFFVSETDNDFDLGDAGGSKTIDTYHRHYYSHTHTYAHTHYSVRAAGTYSNGAGASSNDDYRMITHTQSTTTTSGPNTNYTNYSGDSAHNVLNPYVTLNAIIKYA